MCHKELPALKNFLFICLSVLFPVFVIAQKWEELNGGLIQAINDGEYEKAVGFGLRAVDAAKKKYGESHRYYATALNNLGVAYEKAGNYKEAEQLHLQAMELRKKLLGETHGDYGMSLNNLGLIYQFQGFYEKAEPLMLQSRDIIKNVHGENSEEYGRRLNNLGTLYHAMGQYERAEPFYIQACEIWKKVLGENHPEYATALDNLAQTLHNMGQNANAEPLYSQSLEIRKNVLGENHPDYLLSLNNLAVFYQDNGQYEKAIPLLSKVLELRRKILGEDDPAYLTSKSNLALLCKTIRLYELADTLYTQVADTRKEILGETHPDYANSLRDLGALYQAMGQHRKAEQFNLRALLLIDAILGRNHPDYATALDNLAQVYDAMGQYEDAEPLYLEALEIRKKVLGETHSVYAMSLSNLAMLYQGTGQFEKEEALLREFNSIEVANLFKVFNSLSELEKGNYLSHKVTVLILNNSFLYSNPEAKPSALRESFDMQLLFKGLSLTETKKSLEAIRNSGDSIIQNSFHNWLSIKSILAKQYALPIAERREDLKILESKAEEFEKNLNRLSGSFRNQQEALKIKMADVQKNLGDDESAIEFVRFELFHKKWNDSVMYAAYVLRKTDSVPLFIRLCEEKQLTKILTSTSAGNDLIKSIYRSELDEDEQKWLLGDSLYALVWKPIMPYLKGIKKINFSPAGLLHKIAFNALPAEDSQLLLDKFDLRQYMSVRQIAEHKTQQENTSRDISLFGNCSFEMDSLGILTNRVSNKDINGVTIDETYRSAKNSGWVNLPGTAIEIQNIRELFEKNRINFSVFEKDKASEEKLKSLDGASPAIIHLATHGFFLPDPDQKRRENLSVDNRNAFTLSLDPLLRSGVVLAGANRVWTGNPPIEGSEDGILTAYEISQMDLSKTGLVVLSACETALGDIRGNEGVFGLQRAFKLAGVRNMILSLWKVPDAETAELMKTFYSHYIQGKTIREAFTSAQKEMRAKYKPYYWAAFVLVE